MERLATATLVSMFFLGSAAMAAESGAITGKAEVSGLLKKKKKKKKPKAADDATVRLDIGAT